MKASERRIEVARLIGEGITRTEELSKIFKMSVATIRTDKSNLKLMGLLEASTGKTNTEYQLSKKGLIEFGKDVNSYVPFKKKKIEGYVSNEMKKLDRRMSVLAFYTYNKMLKTQEVAKILEVSVPTISTDRKWLKENKYINAAANITTIGTQVFDNYDCVL
jgi:DNA-binding CsgD family transcriptional regulator